MSRLAYVVIFIEIVGLALFIGKATNSFLIGVCAFFILTLLLKYKVLLNLFVWSFSGLWGFMAGGVAYLFGREYEPDLGIFITAIIGLFIAYIFYRIAYGIHRLGFIEVEDFQNI
jgi:hypothetical protein